MNERHNQQYDLGAVYHGNGQCAFTVWAPFLKNVSLKIVSPDPAVIPMLRDDCGYWHVPASKIFPGARYVFRLDDEMDRPDPASRFQPEGVHHPSEVIDPAFAWSDLSWKGIPLDKYVIYELHTGTFTRDGTFEAVIPRLDYLKELGITAIEIMPVAQFPGARNWGYDGVYPFSPQNSYGGPQGLKALVNACHGKGIAVILDVVYNHLGPDGNYLRDFGPYFTDRYKTPWGDAINFDGPFSDEVRHFFVQNALYWITEFRFDSLRIDAVETIYDSRPKHFLSDLAKAVHDLARSSGRQLFVTAESDLNDVRILNSPDIGGCSIDAQWNDDLHHSLHALITGERNGYYGDFGPVEHLAKAYGEGFVYSGQYSEYRKRRHGTSSAQVKPGRFVVFSQNHDQIGNRMLGERLFSLVSFEQIKLAAACVLLSPYIPLLFMGEEYGETAPFQYFVSHIDEALIEAVRKGRVQEFAHFAWNGNIPDPQDEKTFERSRINPDLRNSGRHKILYNFYRSLLLHRKSLPALSALSREGMEVTNFEPERIILVKRGMEPDSVLLAFSFNDAPVSVPVRTAQGAWTKLLDSSDSEWGGQGGKSPEIITSLGQKILLPLSPFSAVLYQFSGEAS